MLGNEHFKKTGAGVKEVVINSKTEIEKNFSENCRSPIQQGMAELNKTKKQATNYELIHRWINYYGSDMFY